MLRPTALIALTAAQRQRLTTWARAATTPQRLARRARVILGSATGLGSRRLAQQERMSRTTVQRWRARFAAAGCDGLQDRPRCGRPSVLPPPPAPWWWRWRASVQPNVACRSVGIA